MIVRVKIYQNAFLSKFIISYIINSRGNINNIKGWDFSNFSLEVKYILIGFSDTSTLKGEIKTCTKWIIYYISLYVVIRVVKFIRFTETRVIFQTVEKKWKIWKFIYWHRCFPVNFAKILRASFLTEHLRCLLLCQTSKTGKILCKNT